MKLFPCLIALALPSVTLIAQSAAPAAFDAAPRTRFASDRPAGSLLRALDRNHDDTLSPDELAQAPIALSALDLDGDGDLSADELNPAIHSRGRRAMVEFESHAPSRSTADFNLMLALDANHDGLVQPIEVANATSSLKRLDQNGDGALESDELRAQPRHNI